MKTFIKAVNRYVLLSMFLFSIPFFYGIYDISNSENILLIIKNIKIINIYMYSIIYVLVLSMVILALLKMQRIVVVFSIKKDDKNKIIKAIRLMLLGFFIGNFIGLNNVFMGLLG